MANFMNSLGALGKIVGSGVNTYQEMEAARLRQQQAALYALELKNQQDMRRASFGGLMPGGDDQSGPTLAALGGQTQPGMTPPDAGAPPMPGGMPPQPMAPMPNGGAPGAGPMPQPQMPPTGPMAPMPGGPAAMLGPPPSGMPGAQAGSPLAAQLNANPNSSVSSGGVTYGPQFSPGGMPPQVSAPPPQGQPVPGAGGAGPTPQMPSLPGMGSGQMSLGQMFQRLRADPKNQGIPDATLLQMAMKVQQATNPQERMLLQYLMHNQITPYQQAQIGMSAERLASTKENAALTRDLRLQIAQMGVDKAQAAKWQVLTDKSGTNFRYNSETGQALELTANKPYVPTGTVSKMGTAKEPGESLNPETAKMIADRVRAGDSTAMSGLGFGNTGAKNRALVYKSLQEMGVSGTDLAKATIAFRGAAQAAKSVETQGAKIDVAANEMKEFGPKVLEASKKVDRTEYPTLNAMMQSWSKGTGGEDVIELGDWVNAMQNAYAQVVTRGGQSTEGARHKAEEVLNKAWSEGQLQRGVDVLMKEADAAMRATSRASKNVIDRVGSEGAAPSGGGGAPAAPTVSNW
jgi:hypothetical protein